MRQARHGVREVVGERGEAVAAEREPRDAAEFLERYEGRKRREPAAAKEELGGARRRLGGRALEPRPNRARGGRLEEELRRVRAGEPVKLAPLEQAGWVQAKAARLLGMTPRQIAYRIQTMKINVRKI